ncbi:MAG: hypothetical protein ACTSP3_15920 [Candidatus Heimdallarchaeaceae archaeon]
MGKGLTIFLVIFFLLLAAGGVVGGDVYMSYKDMQTKSGDFSTGTKSGDFSTGTPNFTLADNNESVTISTTITTPKLGYIPKSIRLDLVIKKGGVDYGSPQQVTIKLGSSQEVSFTITFEQADITTISGGGTVSVTVEVTATPIYLGIPINALAQTLDPMTIDIHS